MNLYRFLLLLFCPAFALAACNKQVNKPSATKFLGFVTPENFPAPVYHFETNPVTEAGYQLGRRLFYDLRLSRNNTISCGSCHIQASAFTHHGHDVSHGIDDRLGKRNAPAIMNLAWAPVLMWDGGIFDLDLQPIAPITSHEEMDSSLEQIVDKLQADGTYHTMFQSAFGSPNITTTGILKALSQFMLLCVSSNSRYDSIMRGETTGFTANENAGYQVFLQKCAGCHQPPLFTDYTFRNNGIGAGLNDDRGRYQVTLDPADAYKFRVPSLRNLQYTAPYMHDGRFYTLEAVLDHYTSGVTPSATLDSLLLSGDQPGIKHSPEEKDALLAFLNTLNDKKFVTDPLLSEN